MRKQTSNCSAIRERIFGSNGVLDRECAGPCVQCADCRRELAALLRAQQQDWQIPPAVENAIFRETAAVRRRIFYGVRHILIPAAAGFLLLLAAAPLLYESAPPAIPSRAWSDDNWEGTELKQQLALMDQSLLAEDFSAGEY